LEFNQYQELARSTAIYPAEYGLVYTALGLAGESGEVAEKVKKLIRDDFFSKSGNFEDAVASELGDVLWYLANLASEIGMTLEEIAILNTQKLQDRKARGVLKGSGDDR